MAGTADGPEIKAVESVTIPAIVGICLGATLFLLTAAVATCFCYKRRLTVGGIHEKFVEHERGLAKSTVVCAQPRRPTAVRSPAGGPPPPHYIKKSPSPTGARSPPGAQTCLTPSPTGGAGGSGGSGNGSPVGTSGGAVGAGTGLPGPGSSSPAADTRNAVTVTVTKPVMAVPESTKQASPSATSPSKSETDTNDNSALNNTGSFGQLGQLVFKLRYKVEKNTLIVTVVRCRGLPSNSKEQQLGSGSCDPYVKLQLLPEKQHKVKTRVLRKTRDPTYDEDFTFYGINMNQLQSITLHFVVLSFDRYSRDDIIGEVFCSLGSVDLSQTDNHQLTLTRDIQPRSLKIRAQGRGEILVSLCWQPAANRLTVVILKARNLPKMDVTGLADPYVKMYLLVGGQRVSKKKTHVKRRTLNPVFNESFVLELPTGTQELTNVSLEFLLLDWDRVTKNEVIGRLELGGNKCHESAQHHWREVCNSPRRQIAEWHKLRE